MITVEASDVASDLKAYLLKVELGETVVIAIQNRPVAELRPTKVTAPFERPFGLCAGEIVIADDFDAPLSEEMIGGFEGR